MWRRSAFISLALALFVLLAGRVWWQERQEEQPSVILLTVESLRADGVRQDTCPQLLAAAADGYSFPHHRAVSGWTGTNIVTLLSGLSPWQSGVHTRGQSLAADPRLPLKQLAGKGYQVAGLQAFMAMDIYQHLGLDTRDAGDEVLYWLARRARENKPFFLWEHYLHTHLPYRPGENFSGDWQALLPAGDPAARDRLRLVHEQATHFAGTVTFQPGDQAAIQALHDGCVREFDDWFGRFWQFFQRSGLARNTILIVTADHGDEHGERGHVGHASTNRAGHLHEEIVRVPLCIWLPEKLRRDHSQPSGGESSHLDIPPTILARLGLRPDIRMEGRDLFADSPRTPWTGMTSSGGFAEEDPRQIRYFEYGVAAEDWKLLWRRTAGGGEEYRLYHLARDPEERDNLAERFPERLAALKSLLAPRLEQAVQRPVRLPDEAVSAAGQAPRWIHPDLGGGYSYEAVQGRFFLQWSGEPTTKYILHYRAAHGDGLEGTLEVDGPRKDFGRISRRYWETWLVPAGTVSLRVRRADGGPWSEWLRLEAMP